jgi:hypothetical protein
MLTLPEHSVVNSQQCSLNVAENDVNPLLHESIKVPEIINRRSDRDVVHYFNDIVSAQRGYYQKQE